MVADRLINATSESLAILNDNESFSIHQELSRIHNLLSDAGEADHSLQAVVEVLADALEQGGHVRGSGPDHAARRRPLTTPWAAKVHA